MNKSRLTAVVSMETHHRCVAFNQLSKVVVYNSIKLHKSAFLDFSSRISTVIGIEPSKKTPSYGFDCLHNHVRSQIHVHEKPTFFADFLRIVHSMHVPCMCTSPRSKSRQHTKRIKKGKNPARIGWFWPVCPPGHEIWRPAGQNSSPQMNHHHFGRCSRSGNYQSDSGSKPRSEKGGNLDVPRMPSRPRPVAA